MRLVAPRLLDQSAHLCPPTYYRSAREIGPRTASAMGAHTDGDLSTLVLCGAEVDKLAKAKIPTAAAMHATKAARIGRTG